MTNKAFYQLSVTCVPETVEALSSSLFDHGALGVIEQEQLLVAYFEETIDIENLLSSFRSYADQVMARLNIEGGIAIKVDMLEQRDWNEEWKSRLKLLPISDRIVVKPTWVELPDPPPAIVIELDPEMAFGSGEHATSRMTLQLIEKNIKPGMKILDVGTGTGILSIGALLLGAGRAIAFDIDPVATQTAIKNATKNGVADRFVAFIGSLDSVREGEFDIIAANVNRGQIVRMLPHMKELLKSEGCCLLSGILAEEEGIIRGKCAEVGYNITSVRREQEWLAFETRKE